jgi:flagella basal body P-ring formation protein FlgA
MKILWIILLTTLSLFANPIEDYISKKFITNYPNMHIEQLVIKRSSPLPKNFENYKLEDIHISNNNLKREKGSLSATYIYGKKRKRVIYSYKLDANVDVLRANQYISKGKTLTDDLVDFINIRFTNFYQKPITAYYLGKNRARTTIPNGKIITTKHISKVTTLKRGDKVTATLRDGYVIVTFQVTAMRDAYIGDIIKVKKDHKNFYKAMVMSRSQVEIVD